MAHRALCGCKKGDGVVVDHIDGNPLNNRRSNLRAANHQINAWNRKPGSKTGYSGVQEISDGVFVGKVRQGDEYHYCGAHKTAEQAALAVNAKRLELRGDLAFLNRVGCQP